MKKKQFMNVVPQEVTKNGERSLRYKGSDGKYHDLAPQGGITALSVEEVVSSATYTKSAITSMLAAEFVLAYLNKTKFQNYTIGRIEDRYTSRNKIYSGNGVPGTSKYFFNLTDSEILFTHTERGTLDRVDRGLMSTDISQVKDFFERSFNTMLPELTPTEFYYFLKNSSDWITEASFEVVETRLVYTDKDGKFYEVNVQPIDP